MLCRRQQLHAQLWQHSQLHVGCQQCHCADLQPGCVKCQIGKPCNWTACSEGWSNMGPASQPGCRRAHSCVHRFRHDSLLKALAWFVGAPLIASNGQRIGGV